LRDHHSNPERRPDSEISHGKDHPHGVGHFDRAYSRFELMFRLYGPKKEFFDKVWALPDVEPVNAE
jgi:hypothetical protein